MKKTELLVTEEELVDVFMPVEIIPGEKLPMGLKKSDIVYRRIGIKRFSGVIVKGTKEFAKKYETMLDTEARAALREKRCLLDDGKGGFIRCPECNSCSKCEKWKNEKFSTNAPLSFEQLTQAESDDDKVIDIPDNRHDETADALAFMMLDDLLAFLETFTDKPYAQIFQMLFDQSTVQEIADELGIPWSTAKDTIKKVRKLVQEHSGLKR